MQRFLCRVLLHIALVAVPLMLSGCAGIVNPYSSELQCPDTYKGKCVSMETAYAESVNNPLVRTEQIKNHEHGENKEPCENCEKEDPDKNPDLEGQQGREVEKALEYGYKDALYRKLSSLIEQPSTPIVVPPEVMRVLILSYTGSDNELFSYRYVYFFATQPKWIISTGKEIK